MNTRPTPSLPIGMDMLPWSGPLARRCRARLTPEESPAYFGRCELRPHEPSMGHALERGMEIHRWVTEVSIESPECVTWRGVPEPRTLVPPDGRRAAGYLAGLRSDHRPLMADFNTDSVSWSRPMLTLPPEKVPDNWWTRRRFVRTYLSLRRMADLHEHAGHHTAFTAVSEGHIALRCYTCVPATREDHL